MTMAALSQFSGRNWKVLLFRSDFVFGRMGQSDNCWNTHTHTHTCANHYFCLKLENPASHLGSRSSIPIMPSGVDQRPDWEPVPGETCAMNDGRLHVFSHFRVLKIVCFFEFCNPRGSESRGHGHEDLLFCFFKVVLMC